MKICVYAISKNEEKHVARFCKAAKEADLILIADTGSTDDTVSLARKHGAVVHDICISPWRFDHARNAALALVPRDMDVCVSLDLDEVLQPGWREEIERVWTAETTRLRYMFDWGLGIAFKYEKIHSRHGYHWHHPVHEYPVPDLRTTEIWADTDMLLVVHQPDSSKSRGQYMDLLELSVKEDPECPRNAFYHARELTFYRRWHEAIEALEKYLKLPRANWVNERCYAMRLLGRCHDELNLHNEAVKWYRRAVAEATGTREPWCDLAMHFYRHADWVGCYAAAKGALAITDREFVYTCDPVVWGAQPEDLAAIAAWNIGLPREAEAHARRALEFEPDNPRLKSNLESITRQAA